MVTALVVAVVFGFTEPIVTFAATTPSLGVAATYGVLAGTYTNTSGATTINGDIGFTTGPAAIPLGTHTNYGSGAPTPTARTDAANALTAVNTEACDFNFGSTTDLSLLSQPLVPGVYCIAAAASIGTGGITLSGAGTYIFKITGALTTTNNSVVTLTGGASSCDVFWAPTAATTLGADTTFTGTIIDNANAITVGARTAWTGRTFSLGAGTVTTGDAVTMTAPTCAAPQLTVIKTVVNDNGGTKIISQFPLFIDGGSVTSGVANTTTAGLHTVSEPTDPGYTATIGGDCAANGTITLALGDVKTCTITNNDIAPVLHLRKTVINDSGGTAVNTAWTLTATGTSGLPTNLSGSTPVDSGATFKADTYTLSESGGPSGYTASTYSCVKNGASAVVNNSITLATGDNATCTIINDDIAPAPPVPATLRIIKTVVNNSGGVAAASSFNLHVKLAGVDVVGSPATGVIAPGTTYSLLAGTYVVSEDANAGYLATFSGDCDSSGSVTLTAGQDKTCTITNDDIAPVPATLHIVKTVINDNGGTAVASDFTINVAGTNVSTSSFAGSALGVDVALDAGAYSVTEPVVPTGYLQTGSGNCSGTIAAGETKTCIITNDDIAPQLIVNKIVVNDNGGTKVISDFPLFTDGGSVISGVASTTVIGLHTVSEISASGYTAAIGGNCAVDGTITLTLGDVKTCTVTNDDIASTVVPPPSGGGGGSGGGSYYVPVPPLISVVKVPSPLALPDGPGTANYTYTLRNIGTVPVNNVTMVGDTCSPITLISGDTDADARLDVNETWIYTCSTTLSKTHTNIVTATGWSDGISATDIANATVIVGIPVVPPLIHVTKVPSPLVISTGGGMVTYTNKVTNPGTVALSNIRLTDDKCGPVKYVSGDTNDNSKLDTTETWTYTCSTKLTKTTVNTITASGDANGLTARDFAIATVVVAATVPKLPNTGLPPSENNTPWNIMVLVSIFAILTLFYFARRKQTA